MLDGATAPPPLGVGRPSWLHRDWRAPTAQPHEYDRFKVLPCWEPVPPPVLRGTGSHVHGGTLAKGGVDRLFQSATIMNSLLLTLIASSLAQMPGVVFEPLGASGHAGPRMESSVAWPSQEGRTALGPDGPARVLGLSRSLIEGLARVHRFDRHCVDLGLYRADGTLNSGALPRGANADHPLLRFLEHGHVPGDEGSGFSYPGLRGFHFPDVPPSLGELLECTRYHEGYLGAVEAFRSDPSLRPADLLAMLDEPCLMGEPAQGSPWAKRLHRRSLKQNRFSILSNGSFCYLAWGFVQLDDFWQSAGEGSKEGFIRDVLRLAVTSDVSTWMCQRVLYPPLMPTEMEPGRGVARPFDAHRGVIGFTDEHRHFVQGVKGRLLSANSSAQSSAPSTAPPTTFAGRGPSDDGIAMEASLPRLRAWAAVMLDRIVREQGTQEAADAALRTGSMEERLQYWRLLARKAPFEAFNSAYVEELMRMAADRDQLPGAERWLELQGLAAVRELTPEEKIECQRLESTTHRMRIAMIQELGGLLVSAGGSLHVAAVAATLAGPTEEVLSEAEGLVPGGPARATILGNAWTELGLVASDQSIWVLEDHLGGTLKLPDYALDPMVGLLSVHRPPGFEGLMDRVLESESAVMRSRAIMNPNWMDEDRFRTEFGRLMTVAGKNASGAAAQGQLRLNLIGALGRRSDGAGRELLLKTFEDGHWKPGPNGWSEGLSDGPWLNEVWAKLKPSEQADLVQRGLAPAGLFN